jgi:hypothetical protein
MNTEKQYLDPVSEGVIEFKSCYPLRLRQEIFQKMGISTILAKKDMIKHILYAAKMYNDIKYDPVKSKRSLKYQRNEYNKYKKSIVRMNSSLNKIEDNYFYGSYAYQIEEQFKEDVLKSDDSNNIFIKALIHSYKTDDFQKTQYVDELKEFLKILYVSSEKIKPKSIPTWFKSDADPISFWISIIAESWLKSCKIPLTQGHYYPETGYKSQALDILYILMQQIDKSVSREKISTSLKYFSAHEAKRG